MISAEPYERSGDRQGQRNGSYSRNLRTRIGTIELNVPRDREGKFSPTLFEGYQRSEKAFSLALIEMVIQGVSTRKVATVVEEMCGGEGISKSSVSQLTTSLQREVNDWLERPLPEEGALLAVDATYVKVREGAKVVSRAVLVAILVHLNGEREIISVNVAEKESESFWGDFFESLEGRGLKKVHWIVSDQHMGLTRAIRKHFQGAVWQRCQVHFMRNFLSRLSKKEGGKWIPKLREVLHAPTREKGVERGISLVQELRGNGKEELANWLDENLEEALTVLLLPEELRKKCRSTNMLERYNQEIKRRTRVARIYPNRESLLRVVTTISMEKSEEWTARAYLDTKELIKYLSN
jgi:transposase-like protein